MLCCAFLAIALAAAGRSDVVLFDGWTADGEPVSVPHCWNVADGADGKGVPKGWKGLSAVQCPSYERKAVLYSRNLPDPRDGRRQFIRCEGASTKATLLVNGKFVGRHVGAFTAFTFEITKFLQRSDNRLEIVVDNNIDANVPPYGGDFTVYGGLYRPVHYIETESVCIDPVTDGADGVLIDADPETGNVVAHVSVLGGTNEVQRFKFENPKLWSPEDPNLYSLKVVVRQSGSYDSLTVPFGFRKVEFRPDGFYLNGVRRVLHGANRHQELLGKGWALSVDDERHDVEMMKRMGADAVRLCHYPQSSNMYSLCDERGLLVWAEIPNVNGMTLTDEFKANLCVATREFVAQQRNHPSIFGWSICNEMYNDWKEVGKQEGSAESVLTEVNGLIKRLDSSRPTLVAACFPELTKHCEIPDQIAWNVYPGAYYGEPESMADVVEDRKRACGRAILGISEYGCPGCAEQHGEMFCRGSSRWHPDEYQARCHWGNYLKLVGRADLWGVFIWCMFDFGSDARQEGLRVGRNDKGLVEGDHVTLKSAYHFYKANWNPEPELHLVGERMESLTNDVVSVMAFSNIGAVTLKINGAVIGCKVADAVKTVVWRDLPLRLGINEIEVTSGGLTRRARWCRR